MNVILRPSNLFQRAFSNNARKMSAKQEWLVILPDYAGALDKRMAIRPTHLANTKGPVDAGQLAFGGAMLDEPLKDGSPPKINGSVMLYIADTKEEVLEKVKSDVYYESDVWDKEKVQIIPFKSAIRTAL